MRGGKIMKKLFICLSALAITAVGCNKADIETTKTETPDVQKGNVVYLSANLPAFVDTKASVDADGTFAWEDKDVISVLCKEDGGSSFHYIDFKYDASTDKFACDLSNAYYLDKDKNPVYGSFTVATAAEVASQSIPFAYYPAQMVVTTNVNYDKIGKLFKMEGSLANDGSINFVHKSSLLKLDYANVPSIANYVKVRNGSSENVIVRLNGATGSVNTMVPVTPTGSSQTISIELCMENGTVLLTKNKTANVAAGTLYKAPAITINPDVYLISDLTSWTYGEALKMAGTGATRTATLVGNLNKYYRYLVDFGTVQVNMGPATNESESLNETFVIDSDANKASKLTAYGAYDFSFDFVTAKNIVSASATSPQIYLTGSFQTPTAWALNNDTPMTMVNDREGYLVMNVAAGSTFKAYTNPYWKSAFPADNVVLSAANYYLLVADAAAGTLQGVYANATESTATSMTLKGSFDGWSGGLAMTQIESTPFWYIDVNWDINVEFKFVKPGDSGDVWMAYGDGSYATYSSSQGWNNGNISVSGGKYRIIASENDGRFAILDMN